MKPLLFLYLCMFFCLAVMPDFAHAALGKHVTLKKIQKSIFRSRTQIFESNDAGTSVREHARADGVVYGVSWSGIAPPDLNEFLGDYKNDYKKMEQSNPRIMGRRFRVMKSSRLVVERWGHMRNLRGRIFDPTLIPNGVKVRDIQ